MLIALKIEVPARRASVTGVATCLDILRRHRAEASFVVAPPLFSSMTDARAEGQEIGLLTDLRPAWWQNTPNTDDALVERRFDEAYRAFCTFFGSKPLLHASAGWQSTPGLLRLTQRYGFALSSDTRGSHPYVPVWNGEIIRCIQCPATLPLIDELGRPEIDPAPIRACLLELSASPVPTGQLFTLGADCLDQKGWELFDTLLQDWREQGHELMSIQRLAAKLDVNKLPRHEIITDTTPGQRHVTLRQGVEFLSDWRKTT